MSVNKDVAEKIIEDYLKKPGSQSKTLEIAQCLLLTEICDELSYIRNHIITRL